MKEPQALRFDMEKNTYYRINKQTGKQVKSYINGENLPSFKPMVTGMAYKREVIKDPNFYSLKHRSPSRSKSPVQKYMGDKLEKKFATIDAYNPKTQAILGNSRAFQTLSGRTTKKFSFSGYQTPELTSTIQQSFITEGESKSKNFEKTARSFSNIKEEKVRDNHSPKKQEINGSVDTKSILQKMCISKTNFHVDYHINDNAVNCSPRSQKSSPQPKLPQQFQPYNQYVKEKTLFYKFHPDMVFKQNQKSIEKQKDRRRNLIQLQKLIIRTNERKAKSILS